MTLPELAKIIESAPEEEAGKLVRLHRSDVGFSSQYYQEVVSRLGSDPNAAKKLASFWEDLDDGTDKLYDSLRVLALFERTKGQWLKSAEATILASKVAPDDLQRWQCTIGAIDAFGRAGATDRANTLAKQASRKLEELGDMESAGRACINAGNALNWHDDFAIARKWFLKADRYLVDSANEFSKASIRLGLSTCSLFTSTTKEASEAAQLATRQFTNLGQHSYAALAKVNEVHCLLRMGRADEARSLLLEIREEQLSEFDRARVEEFLGDAYLRLNLFEEALDAFGTALSSPAMDSLPMNRGNCELGIGEAYAAIGQTTVAIVHFKIAKRHYLAFGNEVWAACADLRILQIRSPSSVRKAIQLANYFGSQKFRLLEVEALLLVSKSRGTIGNRSLRKAKSRIKSFGFEHVRWQADHIDALHSAGAPQLRAYRRMCKSMQRSREFVSSRSGVVAYYRNKDSAISEYLDLLLSSGSRVKVEEAIRFIGETRSQALLDELMAHSEHLAPQVQERIGQLRLAIADSLNGDFPDGAARRVFLGDAPPISLRRAWIEMDAELIRSNQPIELNSSTGLVFARGKNSFYAIKDGVSQQLPWSADAISKAIRWLRFEMLEPLINKRAMCESVEAIVAQLKAVVWDPFVASGRTEQICPDDCLWHAPWQLFAAMDSMESEIPISPWLTSKEQSPVNFARRVGLWYFPNPELPLIEVEAEMFLSHYPNAEVCSTISEARGCLETGDFDLLHIAGHASLHRTNPIFSALCGKDGEIFAKEIATSKLKARTVVLSACDTGAIAGKSRTEIDGMTRAFLARGTEAVLATQWPLQDESAHVFMNSMYNEMSTGKPMAKAISCARRQTRSEFAHPYFWGAPILYGGYSK